MPVLPRLGLLVMTKIKILKSVSTLTESYRRGQIAEVSDLLAKQWAENGLCEIQVASRPKRKPRSK